MSKDSGTGVRISYSTQKRKDSDVKGKILTEKEGFKE
jgi:hypothetical protein